MDYFALAAAPQQGPSGQHAAPAAQQSARTLAARLLGAVVATKKLMRNKEGILARIDKEGAIFRERLQTDEAREAFSAFAQRRQPDFTKRAS